jgi:Pao retrotransposon peptidase
LSKLNTNHPEALCDVKKMMKANEENSDKIISKEEKERVLGYVFDFKNDTIAISDISQKLPKHLRDCKILPTKRELLSNIMTFYDPLGIAVYFTCKQKLLYRKVCEANIAWDDVIPESNRHDWQTIKKWKTYQ